MLLETFALALQLPPLAFSPAALPRPLPRPRVLTCPIQDLGRPWSPPLSLPIRSARVAMDPWNLRYRTPEPLVNPLADILLLFALAGWASSTGGTVDFRPPAERNPFPAAPLAPIYTPQWLPANPGF